MPVEFVSIILYPAAKSINPVRKPMQLSLLDTVGQHPNAENRVKELRLLLEHHNRQYYQRDAPEISDSEYD